MRPVSNDKRELIITAKQRGENEKTIMKWLNISRSTITKIYKRYQITGNIQPKPYKGNNRKITPEIEEKIKTALKNKPDTTTTELIAELDLKISKSGLSKHLAKMNLSYKKRHSTQRTKTRRCHQNPTNLENKTSHIKQTQTLFP